MKLLVIGSGGREHALVWKIAQSPAVERVFCAPGNAGCAQQAELTPIGVEQFADLADFASAEGIGLTVVGPEAPLVAGVADLFAERGLPIYAPSRAAARLEASKLFTDEILDRHALSRKRYAAFDDAAAAKAYVRRHGAPIVVKADGLAAGKGVKVATTVEEANRHIDACLVERVFGDAGSPVVIEEYLSGQECSVKVFTDGETVLPMVPSQDYKRVGDGDTGDNTGGMGCYSPVPALDQLTFDHIVEQLITPTVRAMAEEGRPYRGTLYAGCILTASGPEILEFNCRFGDPETQVVLPRLESDLVEILQATAEGRLCEVSARWRAERAVCVVIASAGYPGSYETGKPITGLERAAEGCGVIVFHAGTRISQGRPVTSGGRVLGVTALGESFAQARDRAYGAARQIHFDGAYMRGDIALRAAETSR